MPRGIAVSPSPKLWIRVREQRDAPGADEDDGLRDRGDCQDGQADPRHCFDAVAGLDDRAVYEAV